MEEKDSSNFSGLGKAFFSEIVSSEAAMRNLNTEEEKKSKIETRNQEIKEDQEINIESSNNIEQNPEEIGTGIGIGDLKSIIGKPRKRGINQGFTIEVE